MTKEQCAAERNDYEMIMHPDWWPMYPLLPVKNRKESKDGFGLMGVIHSSQPTTVFLCNLFGWHPSAPTRKFESVKDLVAAGWIVD